MTLIAVILRWIRRRRARRLYLRYMEQLEPYDCGVELAEHINPTLREMRLRLEALMSDLMANAE